MNTCMYCHRDLNHTHALDMRPDVHSHVSTFACISCLAKRDEIYVKADDIFLEVEA